MLKILLRYILHTYWTPTHRITNCTQVARMKHPGAFPSFPHHPLPQGPQWDVTTSLQLPLKGEVTVPVLVKPSAKEKRLQPAGVNGVIFPQCLPVIGVHISLCLVSFPCSDCFRSDGRCLVSRRGSKVLKAQEDSGSWLCSFPSLLLALSSVGCGFNKDGSAVRHLNNGWLPATGPHNERNYRRKNAAYYIFHLKILWKVWPRKIPQSSSNFQFMSFLISAWFPERV